MSRQLLPGEQSPQSLLSVPQKALLCLAFVFLAHTAWVLLAGINKPLIGPHQFRQTQTAVSVYWMLNNGPWLAYETPVLGEPWAIPFEFPVYQVITAWVAKIGIPLTDAGRIVAFAFYIAILWPLRIVFREMELGRHSLLATTAIFLASPIYLYWGRSFLIETCALFFSALWLALIVKYITRRRRIYIIAALIAGSLGMLAKSTTFPGFVIVGSLTTAVALYRVWRMEGFSRFLIEFAVSVALAVVIPVIVGLIWVSYSDNIKLMNEFGAQLTSSALATWNFGTIKQRFEPALMKGVVAARSMPETLGTLWPVSIIALLLSVRFMRSRVAVLIAAVGYTAPFFLFSNLHIIHSYYQTANAIFLIIMVGLSIGHLFDKGYRIAAIGVLVATLSGQLVFFYRYFYHDVINAGSGDWSIGVSELAKSVTKPDQSLIVFGNDWSSSIAFMSERKTLTVPHWTDGDRLQRILDNPQSFLGQQTLGAIVICKQNAKNYFYGSQLIMKFIETKRLVGSVGDCEVRMPG